MCVAWCIQVLFLATACAACAAQSAPPPRPARPERLGRGMRVGRLSPEERAARPQRSPRQQRAPPPGRPARMPSRSGQPNEPVSPMMPQELSMAPPLQIPVAPVDTMPPALAISEAAPPTQAQRMSPLPAEAMPPPPPPGSTSDPEEGDLRLVDQVEINGYVTGALQMFRDGAFGSVCRAGFRDAEAQVACRQLGFGGGGFLQFVFFSADLPDAEVEDLLPPVVFENPDCTGAEMRLLDCPQTEFDPYTDYGLYAYSGGSCTGDPSGAFIACGTVSGPAAGTLRLVDGVTSDDGMSQTGRLEVFNEGGWGTVCSRIGFIRRFRSQEAQVACRSLGFSDGVVTAPEESDRNELARVPIWLSGGECTGMEASLLDCPETTLGGAGFCRLFDVVEVVCSSGPDPGRDGNLRLMGGGSGPAHEYGRLEIFIRGFWSAICDKAGFTPDSALVACRALGFDGGAALQFPQPFSGAATENEVLTADIPPGLSAVDCDGTEASLLECISDEDPGGACSVDGSDATDATVLACGMTSPGCTVPAPAQGDVRLRGGFGTLCDPLHSGFVEVFNAGEWGAICDGQRSRFLDTLAADVVCRQLGFPHGTVVDSLITRPDVQIQYYFADELTEEAGEPQERFWLAGVQCRGPEARLVDCDLGAQGFLEGTTAEEVAAACSAPSPPEEPSRLHVACRQFSVPEALEEVVTPGAEEGALRLVGETSVANWRVGRLEIFFEGSWSQVCGLQVSSADTDVACRQLGFMAGTQNSGIAETIEPNSGLVAPEVALTLPGCTGAEERLLDCPGDAEMPDIRDDRQCLSPSSPGLQLACVTAPEAGQEGGLRLVSQMETGDRTEGVLEIFHAGAWGTVCALARSISGFQRRFPERAARVACRQLGLPAAGASFEVAEAAPLGTARPPPWLVDPSCVGSEGRLTACDGVAFGDIVLCDGAQRLVCAPAA